MSTVFIVGATGVLGRNLVPMLLERGHVVRALAREEASLERMRTLGVDAVTGDLLSQDVAVVLSGHLRGCDAVIHIATAIPRDLSAPTAWVLNSRLRMQGTQTLLAAARRAGVRRYIQQSITMAYRDGGDAWLDETTLLDTTPERAVICAPVINMETQVRSVPVNQLEWIILRGGSFTGPGTFEDSLRIAIRTGSRRIAGDGNNFISLVHVSDMAKAIVLAVANVHAGFILNVTATPLLQAEYEDGLAYEVNAAPPPRNLTASRQPSHRCSNNAIRQMLGWTPQYEWAATSQRGNGIF